MTFHRENVESSLKVKKPEGFSENSLESLKNSRLGKLKYKFELNLTKVTASEVSRFS